MRAAAGVIGVLLVLSVIYFFLPVGAKRSVNPFYRDTTVRTSPVPTSRATVSGDTPDSFLNFSASPRASATASAIAQASLRPTITPKASATPTASSSATRVSSLPSTGNEDRNPELLVIQLLASALIIMFGYKLSKHI